MITLHPKYEALLVGQQRASSDARAEYLQARAAVIAAKARYAVACDAIAALKGSQAAERRDLLAALMGSYDA